MPGGQSEAVTGEAGWRLATESVSNEHGFSQLLAVRLVGHCHSNITLITANTEIFFT